MFFSSFIAAGLMAAGLTVTAQDAEVLTAPAAAQDWNVVSRSSSTVYMVDVKNLSMLDGTATVQLARVPASGDASDLSHSITQMDFRCSANQSRPGEEVVYGADGTVEDRINDGYDFDTIPANSLDSYVKDVACDGSRGQASYPSIAAFITAGRPSR